MIIRLSEFNVYSKLSVITQKQIPQFDARILINTKYAYAYFCVESNDVSFIEDIRDMEEPDGDFNELVIAKTSAKLGLDWDGDVIDSQLFISVRDDVIREIEEQKTCRKYGIFTPIVKWFKKVFRRR